VPGKPSRVKEKKIKELIINNLKMEQDNEIQTHELVRVKQDVLFAIRKSGKIEYMFKTKDFNKVATTLAAKYGEKRLSRNKYGDILINK